MWSLRFSCFAGVLWALSYPLPQNGVSSEAMGDGARAMGSGSPNEVRFEEGFTFWTFPGACIFAK